MNARVKELAGGFTELHVENATQIDKIAEKSLTVLALPKITKIRELKPQMRYVNVLARVVDVREAKEFKRPSGEFGRVSSIYIQDETDTIKLNLWNEKATLSKKAKVEDIVLVEGAYTRYKFGKLELNLGKKGQLTLNPSLTEVEQLPPLKLEKRKKISEITGAEGPLTIEATILTTPILREATTSKGEKVKVASFDVTDGTGRINVSFWRKFAELAGKLSPGTRVLLKNVYAKRGFADQLELTTRVSTKVEILSHSELSKEKAA
jgi:replication factor A1